MEARIGGKSHNFYASGSSSLNGIAKRSFEWDLNDWKWDGELFIASPLNALPADRRNKRVLFDAANGIPSNSSSSCSDDTEFRLFEKERGDVEKRRKVLVVEEEPQDGIGSLSLKLGDHAYPVTDDVTNWDAKKGKKCKMQGSCSNRPNCQVEGCDADLSDSKDYHRRHKVCEMHAKASTAMVGNAVQRFCQQCSRFHLLQEFDEGKRSCRRRLAGHNRRRRKTHPDVAVGGNSVIDEHATNFLLITLLRILTNLHSNNSQQSKDQELLAHLLRNLASLAGSFDLSNLSQLLESSQDPQMNANTDGTSKEAANISILDGVPAEESVRPSCLTTKMTPINSTQASALKQSDQAMAVNLTTVEMPSKVINASQETAVDRVRMKDFDLNNAYSDMHDCEDGSEKPALPAYNGTGSPNCPSWLLQDSHQSSPPQTSGNSYSTSAQSLSSSNGDVKCRTDRIIFKLFGKDPNDFPLILRRQILDWLSHSPTDIESYIRPGCVVLTIYLRIAESAWEELYNNFGSSLNRLLHNSVDDFWTRGWVFARMHNHTALIYNGQFVLDIPLLLGYPNHYTILSVKPIAVPHSSSVLFTVKGFNLVQPTVRLLCSFEGKYLMQETAEARADCPGGNADHLPQSLSFSCSLPNASGRGFFEIEDQGISNGFFPFIVAEEDVCSEVRMLENAIDVASFVGQPHEGIDAENARNQALEFIHEFGWLLRRNQIRIRSGEVKSFPSTYSLSRFRWLMAFSINQNWPMVIKKLLDILFSGTVDVGKQSPEEIALSEYLLQSAVRRNSKVMVELLLRYVPDKTPKETGPLKFLFKPDMPGPSGITPLHIAASTSGADSVLDALTNDPLQLGIQAWRSSRDSTGFTPEEYARARGHNSYILLVQMKINKQQEKGQVVFNIPGDIPNKIADGPKFNKLTGFAINKSEFSIKPQSDCKRCSQQLAYLNPAARIFLYRPAMLSMLGIAAVCVCVGLLLKTPPIVYDVFPSFRWELLGCGPI